MQNIAVQSVVRRDGQFFHGAEDCRDNFAAYLALLRRLFGRTTGGIYIKLHAVIDAEGRPISFFMTAGQVGECTGAAALFDSFPKAQWILADRGSYADRFRDALPRLTVDSPEPCSPPMVSPQLLSLRSD